MLEVKNLTIYSIRNNIKNYLLKDICFTLNDGDCLGIIGKSGEGKSTLCKSILGIYDNNVFLENGIIKINCVDFNKSFRGKKISILFQNPNTYLNPLMKVGKQITEMLTYHYKVSKKEAKLKTLELMEEVGLSNSKSIYNYYPYEISGGMQQKVCLCIALICNPEILILDECTAYLDKDSKKDILQLIKRFQQKRKFTLLMISHNFKEIYSMCNKIAIIRKGQLIEFGNSNEIILHPIHPYTIELLCDYLRFYKDIEQFHCPLMNIELEDSAPITMISNNHFVRSWFLNKNALKIKLPNNIEKIKEEIYENLRN